MSRAQQVDVLWAGLKEASGAPLAGGLVYTYYAGTTEPVSLFTAQNKSQSATNPVVLDAAGRACLWADGAYKFEIRDSLGVLYTICDSLLYGLPDDDSIWAGNSSGSANAYVLAPTPALTAYVHGQSVTFVANFSNTGAATANISSLGAKAIKRGTGADLSNGDIVSGNVVTLIYDSATDALVFIVSSTFTTISVSGAGSFGSVVTPVLQSAGAIAVKPSGTTRWNFASGGHFVPEANDAMSIGDSTHHVLSAYIKSILVSAGNNVGFGVGSVSWLVNGGANQLMPNTDATRDFGTPSYRVQTGHFQDLFSNTVISPAGLPLYLGSNGGSSWVIDTGANFWPLGTPGTVDIGGASHRIKDLFFSGKLNNGQSYSTGTYSALRSITHPSSGFLAGSDSVNRATLEAHLQFIYRLIATLTDDTVQ